MRVLLTGDLSGTRDGQEWPPRGSTVDLPEDEAVNLLRNGMARAVSDLPVVEVAVPLTTDTATAVVPVSKAAVRPGPRKP